MPYSELIRQEGEYTYSANIQFDIENDRKLARFIPNETTIDLLREYFVDITKGNAVNHSRILYGSYGTGKSHFLTVLTLLLSKRFTDGQAVEDFLARVSAYDPQLAADISSYIATKNKKPMLVVPIVFDFENFDRCIYFSLRKKLESVKIKVNFKTFYDQALELLEKWKANKESAAKLTEICVAKKIPLEYLEQELRMMNPKIEKSFQLIFSGMTYGVKYIHEVTNLVDNIKQANQMIAHKYSGIVFVFDEFGRYLEDNIKTVRVKSVQDLAEYCDHADTNNHVILVSHREISQYTAAFGKKVADEWKKVEGRYKSTPINDRQDQCLSLVRNVLVKDALAWQRFQEVFARELAEMYTEAMDFKGFLLNGNREENPFEGGFPLHPIALYALDKLSKKVAQNERTFFTYLASQDDYSLHAFLRTHELDEFHFVGIDQIYDYFEVNIKSLQSDSAYEWYKNLQIALSKVAAAGNEVQTEIKLLKVIAAIGVINDTSTLAANRETLLKTIDCPREILSNAIDALCEQRIIKYSYYYNRYEFFEASIYDVDELILQESTTVSDEALIKTLNEEFVDFVLYPNRYNHDYKVSRVFVPVFASCADIEKTNFKNQLRKNRDGALVMLFLDANDDIEHITETMRDLTSAIVIANSEMESLKENVKQYIAVCYLETQKAKYQENDPSFEKELAYYKRELRTTIAAKIAEWKLEFSDATHVFFKGAEKLAITSFQQLSELASQIMYQEYNKTLIVNNELLNKNSITSSMATARKNAIRAILTATTLSAEDSYGLAYLSPEYIAIRSILVKNGFVEADVNVVEQNILKDGAQPQDAVKQVILDCLMQAKNDFVEIENLYKSLKAEPFGLRDGYLPLIFAQVLKPYKESIVVLSRGVEQEISVELFEEMVRRPQDYQFAIVSFTPEETEYLDKLEMLFESYMDLGIRGKNRLKAIYSAIMAHYRHVTKFSRTTEQYVSEETKRYRQLLAGTHTNYSEFLFKELTVDENDFNQTLINLQQVKMELDYAVETLSGELSVSICELFGTSKTTQLSKLLMSKYQLSWKDKRNKSFDYFTNAFLDYMSKIKNEDTDRDIVMKLSKILTGFEIGYWKDQHKNDFMQLLNTINTTLEAYTNVQELSAQEVKMSLTFGSGKETTMIFDKSDLSDIGKTLKNKIQATFNNYAMSVSYDDKAQVLLAILEDIMEGK